jgi:hypothetical protein
MRPDQDGAHVRSSNRTGQRHQFLAVLRDLHVGGVVSVVDATVEGHLHVADLHAIGDHLDRRLPQSLADQHR